MIVSPPVATELSSYYQSYLNYLPENNLLEALENQYLDSETFYQAITEEQAMIRYAENKWLVKEVVGHICDTERILVYRALRIARKDQTPIEGFDENFYTPNSFYSDRSFASIYEEWRTIRASTISFFSHLDFSTFDFQGTANRTPVSVKALLFFIIVHERHHQKVIREKYLIG